MEESKTNLMLSGKASSGEEAIEMTSFTPKPYALEKKPPKPKVKPWMIFVTTAVAIWYMLNLFEFFNVLLGTLAPFPLQRISNSDSKDWINVINRAIGTFEGIKKGLTGDAASKVPLDWVSEKTSYSFYVSALCRETENMDRVCYTKEPPFLAFILDLRGLALQKSQDKENSLDSWVQKFESVLVEALTEVERIQYQAQVFKEKAMELDSQDVETVKLWKNLLSQDYPRGWTLRMLIFTFGFIFDAWIILVVALGITTGKKSLWLDIPLFGGIFIHFCRLFAWFLAVFVVFPPLIWAGPLYNGLHIEQTLHNVVSITDAIQIVYPVVWALFVTEITRKSPY